MNISKSTPYVRYKENFSSTLHLGSIHVESEYLDRTQKTTLESIQGMTWHNKVVNENKELNLLSEHNLFLEGETHKEFFDTTPHRLSVDEVHGLQDIEPNEDGTFTYRITSLEGEYAQIYDGVNNIIASSDTLEPQFEITYDTNEEDLMGNIVLDDTAPTHTIEMSNVGTLDGIMIGKTLVNNILDSSEEEYVCLGDYNSQSITIDNSVERNFGSAILTGQTLVNVNKTTLNNGKINQIYYPASQFNMNMMKTETTYLVIVYNDGDSDVKFYLNQNNFKWNNFTVKAKNTHKTIGTTKAEILDDIWLSCGEQQTTEQNIRAMLIEYQEGMENWDIPYFEGMQSVKMPVLTTTGKNLTSQRFGTYTTVDGITVNSKENEISLSGTAATHRAFDVTTGDHVGGYNDQTPHYKNRRLAQKPGTYTLSFTFGCDKIHEAFPFTGYLLSVGIVYDDDKYNNYALVLNGSNPDYTTISRTIEVNSHINGIFIQRWYGGKCDGLKVKNLQLEEGSVATEYEPYKSNILTTSEEVTLRGVGDVKDELNLLTGGLTQRIGEIVFDGSENWEVVDVTKNNTMAFLNRDTYKIGAINGKVVSDKLPTITQSFLTYDSGNGVRLTTEIYINLLKSQLPTEDIAGFKEWLSQNPITVQYQLATESIKTVDLTVLDQDNNPTTFHSYNETTHINTSSDGLVPFIEIDNPKYEVMLKPNTTYTIKMDRTNVPKNSDFQVNLAGVVTSIDDDVESFTVKTYSTLSNNEMKFIGYGNKFKNVMLLEGNHVNSQIEHFEGMQSVQTPILTTIGKNLWNNYSLERGSINHLNGENLNQYATQTRSKGYIPIVPNTKYIATSYGFDGTTSSDLIRYYDSEKKFIGTSPNEKSTFLRTVFQMAIDNISHVQLEESSVATEYEPYQSNILTVNEPVELRGIGDMRDEFNVETGEYIQRIGEITFDSGLDEIYSSTEIWFNKYSANTNEYNTFTNVSVFGIHNIPNKRLGWNLSICNSFVNLGFKEGFTVGEARNGVFSDHNSQPSFYIAYGEHNNYTTQDFKDYLSKNPITIQYVLEEPIIHKIDSQILDQDGKQLRTFHTFEDTTHIFISSDTLIPNTNINYEITTSVATVIGSSASFDNGEEGSPISAVVYGESKYRDINTGELLDEFDSERELEIIGAESPILTIQGELSENILSTYPQVTLHSIGDIKDEIDYVNETITRRIGKIVLDGSEKWGTVHSGRYCLEYVLNNVNRPSIDNINFKCDKLKPVSYSKEYNGTFGIALYEGSNYDFIVRTDIQTVAEFKQWLSNNPTTVYYQLAEPITESVRITPPNPQTSTASITIPTQLNHVDNKSDYVMWNPYKEHYVRYNHVQDGQPLEHYTWDNLEDLNERQYIEIYDRRTYVEQEYENYISSHESKGTTKYVLLEPNHDYTVSVRFSELPECETVKVNLGGAEVEMDVNNPHVHITTPTPLLNNLCSISGDGLTGKITDILVIHCLYHEGFADIDYFEGIDGIGEVVDGGVNITLEQTNGNLIDEEFEVWNNGQSIKMGDAKRLVVHPNTKYVVKFRRDMDKELAYTLYVQLFNKDNVKTRIVNGGATQESNTREFTTNHDETMVRLYTSQTTNNGSTHKYWDADLCYADMEKDYIRPRYYDKEEILLPMQLCRIHDTYDNLYYDEAKGFYRIQQTIGHKYFTGAENENWTLIENTGRVLRFRYNNADIQIKSLGEYMTNLLPNGTTSSPYESCTFNGTTFIVSLDIERFEIISLEQFKLWLSEHPLHLYYQLMTPIMIDLPQYNKRIEFNTYKDEIYTFFKNCKPTVFTLSVPLDQTYRFYELEQGEGYANRVELTDECMTDEDTLYIDTIHGGGFSNLIENPNNVETLLKPNYQGSAVSHTLTNGKVSSIKVHGFEPNETTIANYNSTLKQYELIVQAQKGGNVNTQTLAVPYKLEVYEDGTKDRVYYSEQYNQWMFEGGSVTNPLYNASYVFNTPLEVFKGIAPRTGLIAEIKVKFNSGTTSARIYYSLDGGATTAYSTLRSMTDEVEYYIGFFNTGGTKLDYATKLSAEAEYTNLAPLSSTLPESLIITQIQNITECTFTLDKTYYFDSWIQPLELDVYNGETIITEQSGAIVTINNNGLHKDALTYTDETYTVYWTYVGGEGNVTITLGGTKVEVVGTQGYATLKTAIDGVQDGLIIGGYNLSIKDLMLIKGERIEDLAYFEGSRAVGTAFVDEDGETKYKITLVTGSHLIQHNFEDRITFEDDKKHNVVITKLLGTKPNKQ